MNLVFSDEAFPDIVEKSIFLAGPSPRYHEGDTVKTNTWRHKAIELLRERGYTGAVYIPLPRVAFVSGTIAKNAIDYLNQINWEEKALDRADVIFFYVDRNMPDEGLTTNVEFGLYFESGRMVYCRPKSAVKVRYLDTLIIEKDRQFFTKMEDGINECLDRVKSAKLRVGDSVCVPNIIYDSEQFQSWYTNLQQAGNRLKGFKVKSIITFNKDRILFGFAAWVSIYITKEDRYKNIEWIFSRLGVSYVVPYYDAPDGRKFILTREFRSPANNPEGYLYELPGGSSTKNGISLLTNAAKELEEETGLVIPEDRFVFLGSKQTFATYLTMKLYACKVQLTEEEFNQVSQRAEEKTVLGENEEEHITLHIASEEDIVRGKYPCDWTQLGLIKAIDFY